MMKTRKFTTPERMEQICNRALDMAGQTISPSMLYSWLGDEYGMTDMEIVRAGFDCVPEERLRKAKNRTILLSREALLGDFMRECHALKKNNGCSMTFGRNCISVDKRYDDDDLYNISVHKNGKWMDDGGPKGVHYRNLEYIVSELLFSGYECAEETDDE